VLDNCVYGDVKFLYVAPERLVTEAVRLRVGRGCLCVAGAPLPRLKPDKDRKKNNTLSILLQ